LRCCSHGNHEYDILQLSTLRQQHARVFAILTTLYASQHEYRNRQQHTTSRTSRPLTTSNNKHKILLLQCHPQASINEKDMKCSKQQGRLSSHEASQQPESLHLLTEFFNTTIDSNDAATEADNMQLKVKNNTKRKLT
jgi:hypothetical protein